MANIAFGSNTTKVGIKSGGSSTFVDIGGITGVNGLDSGTTPTIDKTNFASVQREKMGGKPDAGSMTIDYNLVKGDLGQAAADAAKASGATYQFEVYTEAEDGDAVKYNFDGIVTAAPKNSGGIDGIWSGSYTVEVSGAVTKTIIEA